MQEFVTRQKPNNGLNNLSFSDKQNLVDVFAWLIREDKKQNPALYEPNKSTKYD